MTELNRYFNDLISTNPQLWKKITISQLKNDTKIPEKYSLFIEQLEFKREASLNLNSIVQSKLPNVKVLKIESTKIDPLPIALFQFFKHNNTAQLHWLEITLCTSPPIYQQLCQKSNIALILKKFSPSIEHFSIVSLTNIYHTQHTSTSIQHSITLHQELWQRYPKPEVAAVLFLLYKRTGTPCPPSILQSAEKLCVYSRSNPKSFERAVESLLTGKCSTQTSSSQLIYWYDCLTCGYYDKYGICYGCYIRDHKDHFVVSRCALDYPINAKCDHHKVSPVSRAREKKSF
eukprot:TRINITY_DN7644_c0_g1_i1.p1 TRINITY_DN7644_c0_g1~~TRINITY_DN7644_c0_g1_i1.p1  ORF type:complete len:319 (-),score=53.37 TRINITY_DN7644_c0_g1_i1:37-903(-)